MVDLTDKEQLKKIGTGLLIGGVVISGVAAIAFVAGRNANIKYIDGQMLDIANAVADGGAACIEMVHTSGRKLNVLFFGENGVPKETIKFLKNVGKEAIQ